MKGAIFSLDAAFAIFIAIVVLSFAAYYSSHAEDPSSLKQLERAGYDVTSMLYQRGVFNTLDNATIHDELMLYIPSNVDMKVNVSGSFPACVVTTNSTVSLNGSVVSGSLPLSIYNSSSGQRYTASVRFWIWPV